MGSSCPVTQLEIWAGWTWGESFPNLEIRTCFQYLNIVASYILSSFKTIYDKKTEVLRALFCRTFLTCGYQREDIGKFRTKMWWIFFFWSRSSAERWLQIVWHSENTIVSWLFESLTFSPLSQELSHSHNISWNFLLIASHRTNKKRPDQLILVAFQESKLWLRKLQEKNLPLRFSKRD